jgi:putative ABC transport system substrate-binding protein
MSTPITRRQFVHGAGGAGVGLLVGCGRLPWQAPQPTRVPRLGILLFSSPTHDPNLAAFHRGLSALGYVPDENITIEYRYAEGRPERLATLAEELARLAPDVIFALGGDVSLPMKAATTTIPIVVTTSADPVQDGLVASLARPGGNITGVTLLSSALAGKWLQLLTEAAPVVSRVALVWNPAHSDYDLSETERAASALNVELQRCPMREPTDLHDVFEAVLRERAEGLLVVPSRLTNIYSSQIADFAAQHHLPLMGAWRLWASAGALLTYGPNVDDTVQHAATHVDKILKGAKPADLPVEQPMTFEFVVNLKTAAALGITFPNEIMLQVTEVIQ